MQGTDCYVCSRRMSTNICFVRTRGLAPAHNTKTHVSLHTARALLERKACKTIRVKTRLFLRCTRPCKLFALISCIFTAAVLYGISLHFLSLVIQLLMLSRW